jgi:hypothetical protein
VLWKIQQGKYEEAWEILSEFAQRVKEEKGCILSQVLRHGNEIVGDYLGTPWTIWPDTPTGEIARELFKRITPLISTSLLF